MRSQCLISTSLQRGDPKSAIVAQPFQRLLGKPLKRFSESMAACLHLAEGSKVLMTTSRSSVSFHSQQLKRHPNENQTLPARRHCALRLIIYLSAIDPGADPAGAATD